MDTRSKILTTGHVPSLPGPLVVVTGYFDVLRAEHARALATVRQSSGAATLVAAVLPFAEEVFDICERARMVAALRVVDYVFIASGADAAAILEGLKPQSTADLREEDARRNRQIAEHVRRRENRNST